MNKIVIRSVGLWIFPVFLCLTVIFCGSSQAQTIGDSGKNWKVQFKSAYVHETNLVQDPNGLLDLVVPEKSDGGWNGTANATYTYKHDNKLSLTADYDVDATIYTDLSQYDLVSQMWGLKPRYKFNKRSFFDIQYFYIWNIAGSDSFSGVNYVSPGFSYLHPKWGLTRLHYTYKNTDNFAIDSRDSDQSAIGLTHVYLIPNSKNYIGMGYKFSSEETRGRFSRDVYDFKILGRLMLPFNIQLKSEYKYSVRNYETYASDAGGEREDEQGSFRFRFTKVLKKNLGVLSNVTARMDIRHQNNKSNVELRDYKSTRYSWGLKAQF